MIKMSQVKGIIGIAAVLLAITLTVNAQMTYAYRSDYTLIWSNQGIETTDKPISIWRPNTKGTGLYSFGDVVSKSYEKPSKSTLSATFFSIGEIAPPTEFTEVWNNGAEDSDHVRLFHLIPPPGHVCLGDVAVKGLGNTPDLEIYRCVKSEYTVKDGRFDLLWTHSIPTDDSYIKIAGVKSNDYHGLDGTNTFITAKSLSHVFEREAHLLNTKTAYDLSVFFNIQ